MRVDYETINLIRTLVNREIVFLPDIMISEDATQRQIMYRLEKVNAFLAENNLCEITIGENKEFIISESARSLFLDFIYDQSEPSTYYLNRSERIKYIFLILFIEQDYVSTHDLTFNLQISKSTLMQDIKQLSEILNEKGIKVSNNRSQGYYLSGLERSIRKYMMNIVINSVSVDLNTRVLNYFIKKNNLDTFDEMREIIENLSKQYSITFVEERLTEFIYIFIMIKTRISSKVSESNLYNDIPTINYMNTFPEYTFSSTLLSKFLDASLYETDTQYLTSWILGISVGDIEKNTEDIIFISDLVGKIIKRFEVVSGTRFADIEKTFRHIYSHLRPAYYRLMFKHPITNALTDTVINQYPDIYYLVKEALKPLFDICGYEIPREEISYLTLHFSSIYSNKEKGIIYKKKGLIICLNGVGSSVILYNELKHMFEEIDFYKPLEESKFDLSMYNPDIIFTTHYFKELKNIDVPILKVSPVMEQIDKHHIIQEARAKLGIDIGGFFNLEGIIKVIQKHYGEIENIEGLKHDLISSIFVSRKDKDIKQSDGSIKLIDMISEDAIRLDIEASNWKEAVQIVGKPLVDSFSATQNYVDSIVTMHESEISYFVIIPNVAMPHTVARCGAIKHAFSIGVLKNPVLFGKDEKSCAKFVFFLCAPDNHSHINAMAEFLELINNDNFIDYLGSEKDPRKVYNYIKELL